MTKLKKRISNPMTIIAIFATLSETSAAVSLPFLDNKEREIYIWFLISFPFYLMLLFFATLNFNYRSLYAPSDFEKGEHFLKVLDNAEPAENSDSIKSPEKTHGKTSIEDWRSAPSPGTAQAPPSETGLHLPCTVRRHVQLPKLVQDMHVIDARWMSKKMEFGTLMDAIKNSQARQAHVILFLTCAESEGLLKEIAFKRLKQTRKRSSGVCVTYNLNSHEMTIIDQSSVQAHNNQ